ncbi:MAG: Nramp family divalent metal transporter [Planctomycetaceae bacterium]
MNTPSPAAADSATSIDHGCLPAWERDDLPTPLPFSVGNLFRTIGPGAILLAAAIGGGEWIVGPLTTIKYGRGILWIATIGIVLQTIFNLEAARYTMYTGEPIITGIMRLRPGSRVWSWFYIFIGVAQLATPALAKGCATVLFAAFAGRLSGPGDDSVVNMIGIGVILFGVMLLLSGKHIEKVLELLSWAMIAFIFSFLIAVNILFVPFHQWIETARGFLVIQSLPEKVDWILLATFAATAGSGGLGNLAISNWFRDKGFAMGSKVGAIGNVLAGDHSGLKHVGVTFPMTSGNLDRWRTWWRYAVLDQTVLWGLGCFLGMYLNVNLAASIIPSADVVNEATAGAYQAQYMADKLWKGFWLLTLINGFWILFSTHLGNTDVLIRTVSDICWSAFPTVRKRPIGLLYAVLLGLLTAWAVVAVHLGNVLQLFKVLGIVANPIMAIAAVQIWRVNTRFLPREIRPPLWRQAGLILCAIAYGGMTLALLYDRFRTPA